MASELTVQTLRGPASGANANKILIADGHSIEGAGGVLQVVNVHKSDTFSYSSSYPTWGDVTGLSATITPTSASSKILVLTNVSLGNNSAIFSYYRVLRDSTPIDIGDADGARALVTAMVYQNHNDGQIHKETSTYLDSPATTSAVTYKVQAVGATGSTVYINRSARDGAYTQYDTRQASSLILMEIAG